jgi:hypothetical protein
VTLPHPVDSITQVKVDGIELDSSAFRVDDRRFLVRLDGEEWPRCNDLTLDDDQEGTWSVTGMYGYAPPPLGRMAVGQLATQIFKACKKDKGCLLPIATIREIDRQGVTKTFIEREFGFRRGRIGLYYPDLFISSYNPSGSGMASIYPMDRPKHRRVGT